MDFEKYLSKCNGEEKNYNAKILYPITEEIVRIWCNRKCSEYKDLGRPSLYENNKYIHKTFDFTFEKNGKFYIGEQKNWIAVENGAYINEIYLYNKDIEYLRGAINNKYKVYCNGKKWHISGVILVWPHPSDKFIKEFKKENPKFEILSFQKMVNDLIKEKNKEYLLLIKNHKEYCEKLFKELLPKNKV